MSTRYWSYFFHWPVTPSASLNADEVDVSYDGATDTLFSDLWPLRGPTVNCWVSRYEYLRIEIASRRPVGTQIEDFTRRAVAHRERYLELAALCGDLLKPTESAWQMLTPEVKLRVVHRAVALATRAYDRRHGVLASNTRQSNWIEGRLQTVVDDSPRVVTQVVDQFQPPPPDEWVIGEFTTVLNLIARRPATERGRDFDRILQYWSTQPSGSLKQATGRLLLDYIEANGSERYPPGLDTQPREALLLRSIRAS